MVDPMVFFLHFYEKSACPKSKIAKIAEAFVNFCILAGSLLAVAPAGPPPGGPKTLKNLRFFNDFGFEKLANIEKPMDF